MALSLTMAAYYETCPEWGPLVSLVILKCNKSIGGNAVVPQTTAAFLLKGAWIGLL